MDLASASAIVPTVFVLVVLVRFSLWVLHDARVRQANREPVVVTVLGVTISEPAIWAALCLVLFIVACPFTSPRAAAPESLGCLRRLYGPAVNAA